MQACVVLAKIGEQVRRGTARADTLIAALALFFGGWTASAGTWIAAVPLVVVGVVFLVSSGAFCWRKGFGEAKRQLGK